MATVEGSNGAGSNGGGSRPKASKGRRNWNSEEEEVLLACLKELVATGWKGDNGFRAGYINKLEELMRVHYPRANIRATPHIQSKLTGWKKNYGTIAYILSRSEVGFNVHGDFKIDADNETWESVCNADSNAANVRDKSWIYYDRWVEVFGKDRATGDMAKDVMEAVNELILEDNLNAPNAPRVDVSPDMEENPQTPETENNVSNSKRRNVATSKLQKKRKVIDNTDKNLCDLLGQISRETNERLDNITHKIGHQFDLRRERKEIFVFLEEIPQLTLDERFDICDILVDNPSHMEFFTGLPEAARPAYVYRLLAGRQFRF